MTKYNFFVCKCDKNGVLSPNTKKNIEEDFNEDTKENETHVSGDMASLLHLALYELQKQKEEIKTLKEEIKLWNLK